MFAAGWRALATAVVVGLAAGGCIVENEHSIVDKPAPPDARFAGVWALESGGSAQVLVLSRPPEDSPALDAKFILIGSGTEPADESRAIVTFTTIGGRLYFEVEWKLGEWLPVTPPVRRSFGTAEVRDGQAGAPDTLHVCLAETESFEAPLKSGALTGYVGMGKSYERRMVLASDGAALRSYLAKNHFKCTAESVFQRLTGPTQGR
jgi:hypothetical protein